MFVTSSLSKGIFSIISRQNNLTKFIPSIRLCSTTSNTTDHGQPLHFNPEIRLGMEEWHRKVSLPGSAGKSFTWPTYNDRVYKPGKRSSLNDVTRVAEEVKMRDKVFNARLFIFGG